MIEFEIELEMISQLEKFTALIEQYELDWLEFESCSCEKNSSTSWVISVEGYEGGKIKRDLEHLEKTEDVTLTRTL